MNHATAASLLKCSTARQRGVSHFWHSRAPDCGFGKSADSSTRPNLVANFDWRYCVPAHHRPRCRVFATPSFKLGIRAMWGGNMPTNNVI